MARLYANENFPFPVVEELRRLGHDVVTIQERGYGNQSIDDPSVLEFAIIEKRAILTINRRDFIQEHKKQPNHSGIIICTFDRDFVGQAHRIHSIIEQMASLDGQLIRVNRPAN